MSRRAYLVVHPETIVSVVQTGRFPDRMPEYIQERELKLYETPQKALLNVNMSPRNTFLLVMEIPDPGEDANIEYQETQGEFVAIARQLRSEWVKVILVNSEVSSNLVKKLFNDKCPRPVRKAPENFVAKPDELALVQDLPQANDIFARQGEIHIRKQGDLLGSKMHALVNTVNCVGVMGKGIALAFKTRFPEMFQDYQQRCNRKEVRIGEPYVYRVNDHRIIINFPTKNHWKNNSELAWIESGLIYMANHLREWGVRSIAIPPLGCGNGGLEWSDVFPLIEQHLYGLNIPIEIYAPFVDLEVKPAVVGEKRERGSTASSGAPPAKAFFEKRKKSESVIKFSYINTDRGVEVFNQAKEKIGYVYFEYDQDGIAWFSSIWVNENCRRQGMGQNLIKELLKRFPKLQFSRASAQEGYGILEYRNNQDVQHLVDYCFKTGILRDEYNAIKPIPRINLEAQKELLYSGRAGFGNH